MVDLFRLLFLYDDVLPYEPTAAQARLGARVVNPLPAMNVIPGNPMPRTFVRSVHEVSTTTDTWSSRVIRGEGLVGVGSGSGDGSGKLG